MSDLTNPAQPSLTTAIQVATLLAGLTVGLSAQATDYVVDSIGDSSTADGVTTLREAVEAASTNAVVGDAPAGEADGDTISFAPALAGQTIAVSSALSIADDLSIAGNAFDFVTGNSVVIDGGSGTQLFNVDNSGAAGSDAQVTFRYLVLQRGRSTDVGGAISATGGDLELVDVNFVQNVAAGADAAQGGGAVYASGIDVTVSNALFDRNRAVGLAGSGGAILVDGGSLSAAGSRFDDNESSRAGGAIEARGSAVVSLTNASFSGNDAGANPGNGGALHISGDSAVNMSTVAAFGNIANEGGGFWNGTGMMVVTNLVAVQNVATGSDADNGGGALFNDGGTVNIAGSTFDTNLTTGASGSGGAILSDGGSVSVSDSSIIGNFASRAGGAIETIGGAINLTDVQGDNNDAGTNPGNGGMLHVTGDAAVQVTRGAYQGNSAAEGGALWNGTGNLTVVGTGFTENTATGDGADQGGGAIFNSGGSITISSSTMNDNNATGAAGSGGALFNDGGEVNVLGSAIRRNASNRAGGGVETLAGSIDLTDVNLSDNAAGDAPGNGGALHMTGAATVEIVGGTMNNNIAGAEGGALWNSSTGDLSISGTQLNQNAANGDDADQGGGALFNDGGTLQVIDATIERNRAEGIAGSGGGILNNGGSLSVENTSISRNAANRAGGGIEDNASVTPTVVTLTDTTISDNGGGANPGNGGGIHVTGVGSLIISGGQISGNEVANEGGGLWTGDGTAAVTNIRIFGNSAQVAGGGAYKSGTSGAQSFTQSDISANQSASGGGLFSEGGSVELANVTVSTNAATGDGGGIAIADGDLNLSDVTVAANTATGDGGGIISLVAFTAGNSLFADNQALNFADISGTVTSEDFLLIEDTAGATIEGEMTSVTTGTDPNLDRLSDNGGATWTHALLDESVAIDTGDPLNCPMTDQRGAPRDDGSCDIGAYEAGATSPYFRDLIFNGGFEE